MPMDMETPLATQAPRELRQSRVCSAKGLAVGIVATLVAVVGVAVLVSQLQARSSSKPTPTDSTCPSKKWIMEDLANGHWIINHTDPESWGWYMEFLNVKKEAWPAEFHATDIHQYIFWTNASGIFYIMNHTIPDASGGAGFHLLFEADSNGQWRPNPYPVLTPAGFDPKAAKVDLKKVRYEFEEPGVPFADSCFAWRCDMPMVLNVTNDDGKKVEKEFVVTFWRELTSPTDMRCSLYITEADTGASIKPWDESGYGLTPSDRIPGKPKRMSSRYFKKTTQSFPDAEKRLECQKSGLPGDDHKFC